MRFEILVLIVTGLAPVCGYAQDELPVPERTPPIAVNGGVELTEIEVTRKAVAYAAPEVILSDMRLDFWLPVSDEPNADAQFALRLIKLDAIEDNEGTSLLTEKRRDFIDELSGFVPARAIHSINGHQGPHLSFRVNVPARTATSLQRVKGLVEVAQTQNEIIGFDKVGDLLNKPLKHPKLEDFPIIPLSLKVDEDGVVCRLRLPKEHSLLDDWTLMKNREPLRMRSMETNGKGQKGETIEETRHFIGNSVENLSLFIRFTVKSDPKKLSFDFRDVPLP